MKSTSQHSISHNYSAQWTLSASFCAVLCRTVLQVVDLDLRFVCVLDIFTALHECRRGLAMRILSICPSVCLSVRQMRELWHNEKKSVNIFILYERSFSLVFREKGLLVGATHSTWNFGSMGLRRSEEADFEQIIARSASAVTPSEKRSININRKSTTRFPMSLTWSSYVAHKSPKWAQKRKTAVFPLKSHFSWRKSATKFLYVKTVSSKVVGHSLA